MPQEKEYRQFEVLFCHDTTRISEAYRQFGKSCLDHLPCEESFVIIDHEKKYVFAARDIIGITPLYYTIAEGKVYLETDMGRLFTKSALAPEPDMQTMHQIVHYQAIAYERTMYRGVFRVPPGHYMKILANGTYKIERYWKPEEIEQNEALDEEEAVETFQKLFDDAIFSRIDNIDRTGFELSGGLDSSSVVSWVKQRYPKKRIKAFSMSFQSLKECDEIQYAQAVKNKYDIDLYCAQTDKMDYKTEYSLKKNYDMHPYWPIFITYTMGFSIVEQVCRNGLNTVLTGQGGDNILAGNPFILYDLFVTRQFKRLYQELRYVPQPHKKLIHYVLYPMIGEKNLNRLRNAVRTIRRGSFTKKTDSCQVPKVEELYECYDGKSYAFKAELAGVLHSSLSVLLESSYYTVAEKYYGIRFRHPFFDRQLIEFALSLPMHMKYSAGFSKRLLRVAMKGILPEEIRQRDDKAQFTDVLKQQIDALDIRALFENAYLAKLGIMEQKSLDQYVQRYKSGEMRSVVYFWQLINLEYWYRYNFVNANGRRDEKR